MKNKRRKLTGAAAGEKKSTVAVKVSKEEEMREFVKRLFERFGPVMSKLARE